MATDRAVVSKCNGLPPETPRTVDALLTQVYDKDWQWRSLGEPALGRWKPTVAEDVAPGHDERAG
jgi:hypothetical protein